MVTPHKKIIRRYIRRVPSPAGETLQISPEAELKVHVFLNVGHQ